MVEWSQAESGNGPLCMYDRTGCISSFRLFAIPLQLQLERFQVLSADSTFSFCFSLTVQAQPLHNSTKSLPSGFNRPPLLEIPDFKESNFNPPRGLLRIK